MNNSKTLKVFLLIVMSTVARPCLAFDSYLDGESESEFFRSFQKIDRRSALSLSCDQQTKSDQLPTACLQLVSESPLKYPNRSSWRVVWRQLSEICLMRLKNTTQIVTLSVWENTTELSQECRLGLSERKKDLEYMDSRSLSILGAET